ncbi:hypothetical protein ABES35_17100 [Bacillus subtilis]|uniref:hypothetical protein n=1 Tax=Bacillus subtilis TaxID=1423 RepID=UPI000FFDFE87|nr:hypothetical protein [Bacillus subtilis]MEC2403380.1 hypothetical protein [Bacillus subtilis]MED4659369.1 hypothetical protein [Bacillus subtilis]MED4663674.1 hypothetical protein [Bacillus subtilis]QAT57903.1 hypothetical protein EQW70_11110 [Bacillus subtilis]QHM05673.1 hypothetical protein C7M27_01610 [Bacillus subtilis]
MNEEVKTLRCTVADLIGENERLKTELAKANELLSKSQDVFCEWDMEYFPIYEEIGLYLNGED